jgi:NAD(P)-dependent dehydrogenase (short-subunit alcohol dehydrogenase family)
MQRVAGKTALVTGAAQGIGASIAELFARHGAEVWLSDIHHAKGQATTSRSGPSARYIPLDVAREEDWQEAMEEISRHSGRLDVIVNNAGITGFQENWGPQDPENISLESWNAVHRVNLTGVFLGCKYGIRILKENPTGGSIINISSR